MVSIGKDQENFLLKALCEYVNRIKQVWGLHRKFQEI